MTTHGPTILDVDSAVRSVLAGLFLGTRRPAGLNGDAGGDETTFGGPLLALRHAEAFGAEVRRVKILPGTVVTPLARDLLKRRRVEIGFVSQVALGRVRDLGEWGVAFEAGCGPADAWRRSLLEGPESWDEVGRSADEAAAWVSESGGDRRGALVLTPEASYAAYRASRLPQVRAAHVAEPEAVSRAVRAIGVNVLVVETPGKPLAMVRQIAKAFRNGGSPRAPEGFMSFESWGVPR